MTLEKLQDFISLFPIWSKLSMSEQELLKQSLIERTFKKGEFLHQNDSQCSGLFLVKSGIVRAFIVSESGKEITIYRLLERDICLFSASCVLKNIQFDISIIAETDIEAFLIPTSVFQTLSTNSLIF